MISKDRGRTFFIVIFIVLFASQSCAIIAPTSIFLPMTPVVNKTGTLTPVTISHPTKTLTTDFSLTADFMETASMKDIIVTDIPTATDTPTSVPPGTYALSFFYSPLVMNYDPSMWENKNGLHAKNLTSCNIYEQGPTDFNGPHSTEIVRLGKINYTVLTFPDSSPNVVSWVYVADEAHVTQYGLPVFWVNAKSDEWDECKALAEKVLATLRFPSQ